MGLPASPPRGVQNSNLVFACISCVSVLLCLSACVSGSPAEQAQPFTAESLELEMRDWEAERPSIISVENVLEDTPDIAVPDAISDRRAADSDTHSEPARGMDIDAVNVPLSSVLFALARDADLELVMLQPPEASVTLRLVNATLETAMAALADQIDFRYELVERRLEVSGNAPYTHSYSIDYLNLDRHTESRVGLATQVGTINVADGGQSGIANSSETLLVNSADHHFWASLQSDLDSLLSSDGLDEIVSNWTINRDSGLLTMYGSLDAHRRLKRYLSKLHDSARRQVLIEATVVEVALSDSFQAGIDWQVIASTLKGISAAQVLTGAPLITPESAPRIPAPNGLVSLVQQTNYGNVRATLSLLEQFGDVRILSRPRIIALNNQSSVLKVVDNRVYFTLNVERRRSDDSDELVTESQIHTVPVGLVMNVTPFIDSDKAVMLNVRPTLSRILGFVNDPNPALAQANVKNGVPEIQVREMESMLRVADGELAIIGGLMQETTRDTTKRIPGLGQLPGLGKLFTHKAIERTQTELLIVLRPTIMPESGFATGNTFSNSQLSTLRGTLTDAALAETTTWSTDSVSQIQ